MKPIRRIVAELAVRFAADEVRALQDGVRYARYRTLLLGEGIDYHGSAQSLGEQFAAGLAAVTTPATKAVARALVADVRVFLDDQEITDRDDS